MPITLLPLFEAPKYRFSPGNPLREIKGFPPNEAPQDSQHDDHINTLKSAIRCLNRLIEEYNNETDNARQNELLLEIYYYRQSIISNHAHHFSEKNRQSQVIGFINQYLHRQLFSELKKKFGQTSLFEDELQNFDKQNIPEYKEDRSSLTLSAEQTRIIEHGSDSERRLLKQQFRKIIAETEPPEKKEQYRQIIIQINQKLDLKTIDQDAQTTLANIIANLSNAEAVNFIGWIKGTVKVKDINPELTTFLRRCKYHTLFERNSSIILIQKEAEQFILKLEPQYNPTENLAPLYPDTLVPEKVRRALVFNNTNYNLVVTDYCPSGNLYAYGMRQFYDRDKLQSGITMYKQVAAKQLRLEKAGLVGTDLKSLNWGVDEHVTPRIIDVKALYPSNTFYRYKILDTETFSPPERKTKHPEANKFHAFTLGINLYSHFTGLLPSDFTIGMELTFDAPIFQSEIGLRLKKLIQDLTAVEAVRITVQQAYDTLQQLEKTLILDECAFLLRQLYSSHHFVVMPEDKIKRSHTHPHTQLIRDTFTQYCHSPELQECRQQFNALNQNTDIKELEAFRTRLKQTISKVPLEKDLPKKILISKCNQLLSQIWLQRFGDADQPLRELITESRQRMANANNLEDLQNELQTKLSVLQNSPTLRVIKARIAKLREWTNVNFSFTEMFSNRLANILEAQMASTDIETRTKSFNELPQHLHLAFDSRGVFGGTSECFGQDEQPAEKPSQYIRNPCGFFNLLQTDVIMLERSLLYSSPEFK